MQTKKIISISSFFIILLAAWFAIALVRTLYEPLPLKQKHYQLRVHPGSTIYTVADQLHRDGLLRNKRLFIFASDLRGDTHQLRFGEYVIKPGMNAADVLSNISSATGLKKYKVLFVEGWTFRDMKRALRENKALKHTVAHQSNAKIMAALGYPKQKPEGRFFPDTYVFAWGNSDLDVLKQAYRKMQRVIKAQWKKRANDLPYKNPYQALIVASLIEKETAIKRERPIIAGVILRRLKKGMRLQIDPTILYGLGKPYDTPITSRDIRSKTPYNTYVIYGLPPTPIDMPSLASIKAALHPSYDDYLYYVAKGDGSHIFSVTYQEHLLAVKKYRMVQYNNKKFLRAMEYDFPYYLKRSPWVGFASYILCFNCMN